MNIWKRCECISGGRACETHIEGVVEIEVVVAVKVSANKVVDLGLGGGVEVLELVHGLELDDIESVGEDAIWLTLEEMLGLISGNMRYSSEYIGAVGSGTLYAVAKVV